VRSPRGAFRTALRVTERTLTQIASDLSHVTVWIQSGNQDRGGIFSSSSSVCLWKRLSMVLIGSEILTCFLQLATERTSVNRRTPGRFRPRAGGASSGSILSASRGAPRLVTSTLTTCSNGGVGSELLTTLFASSESSRLSRTVISGCVAAVSTCNGSDSAFLWPIYRPGCWDILPQQPCQLGS
jgi:hypothetical protein